MRRRDFIKNLGVAISWPSATVARPFHWPRSVGVPGGGAEKLALQDRATPSPGISYDDGSANAPAGPPQRPDLLASYGRNRPSWKVAGVDYAVGVPANLSLKDPVTINNGGETIPGFSFNAAQNLWRIDGTEGPVLDGFDFSIRNASLLLVGSPNGIIRNCNLGGITIQADARSPGLYVGYCASVGNRGGMVIYSIPDGAGAVTVEYCYFARFQQHVIELGRPERFTMRYNLIEDGGVGAPGAHLNYSQFSGGHGNDDPFDNVDISFNCGLQHRTDSGGEGWQIYTNGKGTFNTPTFAYNVCLAGPVRGAISYWLHIGAYNANRIVDGRVHDNYFDLSGAYGPFYPGASGVAFYNNRNMKTGTVTR